MNDKIPVGGRRSLLIEAHTSSTRDERGAGGLGCQGGEQVAARPYPATLPHHRRACRWPRQRAGGRPGRLLAIRGPSLAARLREGRLLELRAAEQPAGTAAYSRWRAGLGPDQSRPGAARRAGPALQPLVGEETQGILPRAQPAAGDNGRVGTASAKARRRLFPAHEDLERIARPTVRGQKTASWTSTTRRPQEAP